MDVFSPLVLSASGGGPLCQNGLQEVSINLMVATKHNQSYVLRHTRLASLLSRVLKAHTSDFVSHSSDHRALFTLFQLQFGAMSPNRAIKLECVSSIVWDKASVEDLHYMRH